MINASQLKNGTLFEYEGSIVQVISFQMHRKSQSASVMRVKFRNLNTGAVVETAFSTGEKFKEVDVQKRAKNYMYTEGQMAHFMDMENYEQIGFPLEKLGDQVKFLVENMECEGMYLNEKLFSVELPVVVVLTVKETVPGVKGDSVSNMTKVATLETGYDIKVPLFINEGEKIRVDTRTGQYVERA